MKVGQKIKRNGEEFTVTEIVSHKKFFTVCVWVKDKNGNAFVIAD